MTFEGYQRLSTLYHACKQSFKDFQGVNLKVAPADSHFRPCRQVSCSLCPNSTPLCLTLSPRYSPHWCRRWRWHKVWISNNMGGKSFVIFYCPLLSRVMVLLNCAESNGAILRSALEWHDYSLLGFQVPFLPQSWEKARIVSTLAEIVYPCRIKGQSEVMSVYHGKCQKETSKWEAAWTLSGRC